jgi:tight adherence protein C
MALRNRLLAPHQPPTAPRVRANLASSLQNLRVRFTRRSFTQEHLQFAAVTSVFALLLENGLPVSVAIRWLQPRLSGFWLEQFGLVVAKLDLGADLVEELGELAKRVPLAELNEFCQKLQISIERGTPSAHQVSHLSESIQHQVIRNLIRRAGQNETKMLIPTIFLILPVTVLFAIFPSLLVLQSGY